MSRYLSSPAYLKQSYCQSIESVWYIIIQKKIESRQCTHCKIIANIPIFVRYLTVYCFLTLKMKNILCKRGRIFTFSLNNMSFPKNTWVCVRYFQSHYFLIFQILSPFFMFNFKHTTVLAMVWLKSIFSVWNLLMQARVFWWIAPAVFISSNCNFIQPFNRQCVMWMLKKQSWGMQSRERCAWEA